MLFSQGSNYDRAFRICIFAVDGVGFPLRLDWLVLMVCLPTVSRGWTAGSEDMASSCICIQTNKAAFNSFPQKNSVFFWAFLHFYHENHVSFRAFTLYKTMIFCRFQPFFRKNHILFNEFQPFYWEYPSFFALHCVVTLKSLVLRSLTLIFLSLSLFALSFCFFALSLSLFCSSHCCDINFPFAPCWPPPQEVEPGLFSASWLLHFHSNKPRRRIITQGFQGIKDTF